jgi:hypothetical protein
VLAINIAWWDPDAPELLSQVAATVKAVFPSVCTITGISGQSGAVLLAGCEDISPDHLLPNATAVAHDGLLAIVREICQPGLPDIHPAEVRGRPFTDDCAPVEKIADRYYRQLRERTHRAERRAVALEE